MARIRSKDAGKTWQNPEDVTSMFMNVKGEYKPLFPEAYSMFFASGRILQSKVFKAKNSKYYRLYASLLTNSAKGRDNYVVYSDDFGQSWNLLGDICVKGGDEAKVEELNDGSIVISSRKSHGRFFNIFTFTDIEKANGDWQTEVCSNEMVGGISVGANSCNGELLKVRVINNKSGKECDLLLQSLPTGDNRKSVTIFFKELDDNRQYTSVTLAENWTKGIEVSDRLSAYSTMILQSNNKVGFLFEEEPNDYCIVYTSFTIEQITNGQYRVD
jgi:sialidase-1